MTAVPANPLTEVPLDTIVAAPSARAATPPAGPAAVRPAGRAAARSLPLFQAGDDEPLVKLPAAPRPPLAVRRTPERPRRVTPRAVRRARPDAPILPIAVDPASTPSDDPRVAVQPAPPPMARPGVVRTAAEQDRASDLIACGVGLRLLGAGIDHGILLAIDAAVVYFTLRIAGLAPADWWLLPPAPLASFLLLLKFAYFSVFTMVGGQTIGKMAVGTRVVADDGSPLEPARAIRRTLVGAVAMLAAGAGLVPLLAGGDRRGFHDRMARTRVIALPSERRLA